MTSPFALEAPAVLSLSGGRTSGYLLRRVLDEGLPADVHVLFCNTGKEDEATLRFVHEIEERWGVPVHWLEYERHVLPRYKKKEVFELTERLRKAYGVVARAPDDALEGKERGFREVTFETAARKGEPYVNYVCMSGLPNPATRTCTTELKVRVMKRWMLARGYAYWDMVMGIRADEPRRVQKLRASPPERWEHVMPLAYAGVMESDVLAYWRGSEFDLGLEADPEMGTYRGNCDGCMLKATEKLVRLEREEPGRLDFWAKIEEASGSLFRRDRANYRRLQVIAAEGTACAPGGDLGDCFCHD